MRQQYHRPSNDASRPYERKRCVTIVFRDSPFLGQKGLILKETLGRHSDLRLELSSGQQIRIDAAWTDYVNVEPSDNATVATRCIDFTQAEPIIQFLEYLKSKQKPDDCSPAAAAAAVPDSSS